MRVRQAVLNGPIPALANRLRDQLIHAVNTVSWQETTRLRGARSVRKAILDQLTTLGWSDPVRLRSSNGITITAMNQRTALCLQTGNMARFYADLMKLQLVFIDNGADAAIYVVPTKRAAARLGSNMVNYERVLREARLFQKIVTLPLVLLGFEDEEGT